MPTRPSARTEKVCVMSKITKQRKLSETAAMLAARRPQPYELWRTLRASDFNEARKLEGACHIGMYLSSDQEYPEAVPGGAACAAEIHPGMRGPGQVE